MKNAYVENDRKKAKPMGKKIEIVQTTSTVNGHPVYYCPGETVEIGRWKCIRCKEARNYANAFLGFPCKPQGNAPDCRRIKPPRPITDLQA